MDVYDQEVSALRLKLDRGWASLEKGGGGSKEEQEDLSLLARTMEEGSEVEKLSKHLSMQMEYNNELLREMAELEKRQLSNQKELSEKQSALRQAIAACETARADIADYKYKLEVAQDVAARAIEECNTAKVEAGIKSREAEALLRFVEESKNDAGALRLEREDMLKELQQAQADRDRLREELIRRDEEENLRSAEQRSDFESLNRDIAQAKSRLGPLEAELRAERSRASELAAALEQRNASLRDAEDSIAEARSLAAQAQDRCNRAEQAENDMKHEMEQKNSIIERLQEQLSSARELSKASEAQMDDQQRRINDLSKANHDLDAEVQDLKMQLETIGNDLHAQTLARRQDREHLEAKVAEARDELARATDGLRTRERQLDDDQSRRNAEITKLRRDAEEAQSKLQDQNKHLHDLLQRLQKEHAAQLADFQNERESYDERLGKAIENQRQAEARVNQRDAKTVKEVAALREELLDAQQQLTQRTQVHVDTLGALENTLHQLASESQKLQAAHDGLLDEVEVLRAAVRDFSERGAGQIEAWHGDTKRTLSQFADSAIQGKADAESARQAQLLAEVQRDEERSRTFMLEEERSRLEDEIHTLQEKLRGLEQTASDRVRSVALENESIASAKSELDLQVKRLQVQLEKANAMNRSLHDEHERAIASHMETASKQRRKIEELQEKLNNLDRESKDAIAEKETLVAEQSLLKKQLEGTVRDLANAQDEMKKLETSQLDTSRSDQKNSVVLQKQVGALTESMRKQQTQLTQTKSLLSVVQEQRKHLQEEVLKLRAELDQYLNTSINNAAASSKS